jgi:cytochrome c6
MKKTISLLVCGSLFFAAATFISAHSPADQSAGADTFKAKCAVCHGADGGGNTPMGQKMKIRDLRSPEVQKQSDDEITAIIAKGKPPMPAYGKSLAAGDIRQLVAYIRSIASKS